MGPFALQHVKIDTRVALYEECITKHAFVTLTDTPFFHTRATAYFGMFGKPSASANLST
jgi:hypothetical protein